MTWYAGNNSTNNGSLGWLFEASGGGGVTVNVTGVSATGQVGSVTVSTIAIVAVTGVSGTGAVGSVTISAGADVPVTGVSATGQVGSVAVRTDASGFGQSFNIQDVQTALGQAAVNTNPGKTLFRDVVLSGRMLGDINNSGTITSFDSVLYGRWGFGSPLAVPADNTYIETVLNAYMTQNPVAYAAYLAFGYGQVGSVTIAASATVPVTGVSATGQIGSVTVVAGAVASVTGVSATGDVGSVTVDLVTPVPVTGVQATGQVGSVAVTGTANVSVTGLQATAQVGSVTIELITPVPVTGVSATGQVGSVTAGVNTSFVVTGVSAQGLVGGVLIWGLVDDSQTPNWININDSQVSTWTSVNDTQTSNWVEIVT